MVSFVFDFNQSMNSRIISFVFNEFIKSILTSLIHFIHAHLLESHRISTMSLFLLAILFQISLLEPVIIIASFFFIIINYKIK